MIMVTERRELNAFANHMTVANSTNDKYTNASLLCRKDRNARNGRRRNSLICS